MPYRIEYAATARAGCKGAKPCMGTKIAKGELRLGTQYKMPGRGEGSEARDAMSWRHYGCISAKVLQNIKADVGDDPADLDGFEDLREEDQEKIRVAFEAGHIDDADIPDSARKPPGEEGAESPKKKKAAPKRKKKEENDDEEAEAKPKKKRAPPKKKKASEDEDDEDEEEVQPKPKKRAPPKKKKAAEVEEWPESE